MQQAEGAVRLVEEYRGGILENTHDGFIAVVDVDGHLVGSAGNVDAMVFYRSASKPIQALPVLAWGLDKEFGFSDEELAIMASSHRGEPFHVAAVEGILTKIGCREADLCMQPVYPSHAASREAVICQGGPKRRIYHNCSGKHAAMLTMARHLGVPVGEYWRSDHPVQRQILKVISMFTEVPLKEIGIGVDGCGVPVFAVPLRNMALGAMKLACPDRIDDSVFSAAATSLGEIITRLPLYITGTNYICSLVNMDPNLIAKGGARGVYTIGMRKERLGIAFKVRDGSEESWPLLINEIFAQLGYKNEAGHQRMLGLAQPQITNDNDEVVGESRCVFSLGNRE
ncbi:MAG: asparaginase [Symbiobacteriaceae bacterium]|nr:asparaginase [Symbiobacteriaceae bacterium]